MEKMIITCPWCKQKSPYEVDLEKVCIDEVSDEKDINVLLDEWESAGKIFKCRYRHCLVKFEAVLCKTLEIAENIQRDLQGIAWFGPRHFQPYKNEHERHEQFAVLFNRKKIPRNKYINLNNLVDVQLITKAILGFAVHKGVPLGVFEAFTAKDKVFWVKVEPDPEVSAQYTPICNVCREAFKKREEELLKEYKYGKQCDYWEECDFRSCMEDGKTKVPEENLCLLRLDIREKINPCHKSDCLIIEEVGNLFEEQVAEREWPIVRECWLGLIEVAYPIIVHDHLLAVVMTGQFFEKGYIPTIEEIVAKEKVWREKHNMEGSCVLGDCADDFKRAGKADKISFPVGRPPRDHERFLQIIGSKDVLGEIYKPLREDIALITEVAQNSYLRWREMMENAFRTELSGTLSDRLFEDRVFRDFLRDILARMRDFWAIERVCLFMGQEWEEDVRLYATDCDYLADEPIPISVRHNMQNKSVGRGIVVQLDNTCPRDKDYEIWRDFLREAKSSGSPRGFESIENAYFVQIKTGGRFYVFGFCGRQIPELSILPYIGSDDIRFSNECKEQILQTCQAVAEGLHHFWVIYDQEQLHGTISHTIRSLVALMIKPRSKFRRLTEKSKEDFEGNFPDIYQAGQDFLQGIKIGALNINDELDNLAFARGLEQMIGIANIGTADLMEILNGMEKQYKYISKDQNKPWTYVNPSILPVKAIVCGEEAMVRLVVRNVIDNAYKYGRKNYPVEVRLDRTIDREEIERWNLIVTNVGVPIEKEEMDSITKKNYRGIHARRRKSQAQEGTGLGMYLVKRIMERIGGKLITDCKIVSNGEDPLGEIEMQLKFLLGKEK
jgi:hypothetical protein